MKQLQFPKTCIWFVQKKKIVFLRHWYWPGLRSIQNSSSDMWNVLWQSNLLFPYLHGIDVLAMIKVCKYWKYSIQQQVPKIRRTLTWNTLNYGLDSVNFTSNWYTNGDQSKQLVFLSCVRKCYLETPWVVQVKLTVSRKKGKPQMEIQFQTMTYPDCVSVATWFDIIACFHAIPHLHMVRTLFYMIPCFQ